MTREMLNPKFYVARRDTRWDVYPQRQPEIVVAHDYHGFWARDPKVGWFKTPTSYVLIREITREEAETTNTESGELYSVTPGGT